MDLAPEIPPGPIGASAGQQRGDDSARELLEEIAEEIATVFEGRFPPQWVGVIDTSVLLDVIVDSARSGRQSLVVIAGRSGLLRMLVTREQVAEVERRLERRARGAKVSVQQAREMWGEVRASGAQSRERVTPPSIGAVLARSMRPMSSAAVAEATGAPLDQVESVLRASRSFTPVRDGWVIGVPHSADRSDGDPSER